MLPKMLGAVTSFRPTVGERRHVAERSGAGDAARDVLRRTHRRAVAPEIDGLDDRGRAREFD